MINNYTALKDIIASLLDKDIDFQLNNTLDGNLMPVKQLHFMNYTCQCDLEELDAPDLFWLIKEDEDGELLETRIHSVEEFRDTILRIIEENK